MQFNGVASSGVYLYYMAKTLGEFLDEFFFWLNAKSKWK